MWRLGPLRGKILNEAVAFFLVLVQTIYLSRHHRSHDILPTLPSILTPRSGWAYRWAGLDLWPALEYALIVRVALDELCWVDSSTLLLLHSREVVGFALLLLRIFETPSALYLRLLLCGFKSHHTLSRALDEIGVLIVSAGQGRPWRWRTWSQ